MANQLTGHAIWNVNASFARIKCLGARHEARTIPPNGRIFAPVLAGDEQTVVFGDGNGEGASNRAILMPVDNCGHVDEL